MHRMSVDGEAATGLLARRWAMLLRSRRRDGSWVDTPVNVAVENGRAYFGTPASSGKVNRLRNFDQVEVSPSTPRGKPTGPTFRARAVRLDGEESAAAERRLRRKYPIVYGLIVPIELRLKRTRGLVYELTEFEPAE